MNDRNATQERRQAEASLVNVMNALLAKRGIELARSISGTFAIHVPMPQNERSPYPRQYTGRRVSDYSATVSFQGPGGTRITSGIRLKGERQ